MARLLAFADLHLWRSWPEWNPLLPSGLTKRLGIQLDVWKQLEKYAIDYKVSMVIGAGDIFNKRSYLHTTEIATLLELHKKSPVEYCLTYGNHDRLSQQFNSVQSLDCVGNTIPQISSAFLRTMNS